MAFYEIEASRNGWGVKELERSVRIGVYRFTGTCKIFRNGFGD